MLVLKYSTYATLNARGGSRIFIGRGPPAPGRHSSMATERHLTSEGGMMHSEGGITVHMGGIVTCRTWELQDQGLAGTEGACKSLTPGGTISIGRGLQPPPRPSRIRECKLLL